MQGIHQWPVVSQHQGPVMRMVFKCHDIRVPWFLLGQPALLGPGAAVWPSGQQPKRVSEQLFTGWSGNEFEFEFEFEFEYDRQRTECYGFNSLASGGYSTDLKIVFSEHILWISLMSTSYETSLMWMSQNTSDDNSTMVQVTTLCYQAASHYLSQCWPKSLAICHHQDTMS